MAALDVYAIVRRASLLSSLDAAVNRVLKRDVPALAAEVERLSRCLRGAQKLREIGEDVRIGATWHQWDKDVAAALDALQKQREEKVNG